MKKWMKYISPYKKYFILGPICMLIEVIGEIVMPKLLSYIIDFGIQPKDEVEIEIPLFVERLYNTIGASGFVALMAGLMVIMALLMMAGGVGGAYFGGKAAVNFAADLRLDVYKKIQSFSFNNIDKFSTGSLVTRTTNDVTQLQNFVNMLLRMFIRAPGMMIGACIMAISLNPELSVILAISIPVMVISVGLIVWKGFPKFSKMQTKIDAINQVISENLTNVRVVKSFVREEKEKDKFQKANENLKKATGGAMGVLILMSPVMTLIMNATSIAVYWFGGNMLAGGTMSTGTFTAFVTYITQILFSLTMVTFLFMALSRALASSKRIREVLDEDIDIQDCANSDLKVEKGEVEFKNVSYRYYKNSEEMVLKNVSLSIHSGQTIGIIGSTGCGKTTLVSMIPRLYDVDEGEVLVDGHNVKEYSLSSLREGVGMVLQNNVLFSGSIEDNLKWGDFNADHETIRKFAQYAQADGFVESFKDKYASNLGQGGTNVSGGQKQRLCIARALLKMPKILILDDSTSAVDTATERNIRRAFREELPNTTKIIIAQRISSVKDADIIVVMNEGEITGLGTHETLLSENKEYQEIFYSQNDKKEVE